MPKHGNELSVHPKGAQKSLTFSLHAHLKSKILQHCVRLLSVNLQCLLSIALLGLVVNP